MIQPIIRVDNKELILNQTFLIEEETKSLDINIPTDVENTSKKFLYTLTTLSENINLLNLILMLNFIKTKTKNLKVSFDNGIFNIDVKFPAKNENSTFSVTPTTFNIKNKKFSIYTEIKRIQDSLYRMNVSIYTEDR